jgi:hypothetical protein
MDINLSVLRGQVPFEEAISFKSGYDPGPARAIKGKILARIGEYPVAFLGFGEMGVAYGLPSGKVLKLTEDRTEVEAMAAVRKASHPNLIQVFDAFFAVDDPEDPSPIGVGVVVRESVDMTLLEVPEAHKIRLVLFEVVDKAIRETELLLDRCAGMAVFSGLLAAAGEELTSVERFILDGIQEGISALRSLGVCSVDFGPGNVGLIAGRPVLFDVGMAKVRDVKVDIA